MKGANAGQVNRSLATFLRGLFSFAIAFYLIRLVIKSNKVDLPAAFAQVEVGWFIVAVACFGLVQLVAAYRWGVLLRTMQIELAYPVLVRLTMIGQFFNLAVPGGIGGDLLKMVYARREAPKKTTEAVTSILLDRVFGLLGLLLIALIATLFSQELLRTGPAELRVAVGVVATGSTVGLSAVGALFASPWLMRFKPINAMVNWFAGVLPEGVRQTLLRVIHAILSCRSHPLQMLQVLALSMVVHGGIATLVCLLGFAFSVQELGVADYFLATQVANVVAAIPLTPGGLGGRDLVLALFFTAAGAPKETAGLLPTILSLILVFWSLVGGLFFVFERRQGPPPEAVEIDEL